MRTRCIPTFAALAVIASFAHAEDHSVDTVLQQAGASSTFLGGATVTHTSAGAFTDTLTFSGVSAGEVSARLATVGFRNTRNIDFTSVSINGQDFSLQDAGPVDFARFGSTFLSGPLIVTVQGIAAPDSEDGSSVTATYGGTVHVLAVPETSGGLMLLAGLGVVALLVRRRQAPR